MNGIDQLGEFNRFVAALPAAEQAAPIDELYDRWRSHAFAEEDFVAVEESLRDFRAGDQGAPHDEVMAKLRHQIDESPS